jgi:hypothetical protein
MRSSHHGALATSATASATLYKSRIMCNKRSFRVSNLKMIQSNAMPILRDLPLCAVLGAALIAPASAAEHKVPPIQPATAFAAVEVHDAEQVAIAAEPYDTREKASLFRIDYLAHGILPVRLIVTNNGNRPLSLRDARILFYTAGGDRIQAAEPEDVERLMTRTEREGKKIPMPGPFPSIKTKPKASNKAIEEDFNQFEYQALVVEPHTTRAGFLFYDVSQLAHPLEGAKLHLRMLRDADGNELFYFEIPFDTYLKSKSTEMK